MRRALLSIPVLCASLGAIAVACSGSTTALETCGAGTIERDGRCVLVDSGTDLRPEGGGLRDAAGNLEEASVQDGSTSDDAASHADSSGPAPADPCPAPNVPIVANCNPNHECGTGDPTYDRCMAASCADDQVLGPPPIEVTRFTTSRSHELVVRTPNHFGTHPDCATCAQDGGDSFAYSIAIKVPKDTIGYRVAVDAPWTIYLMDVPYRAKKCPSQMKETAGNSFSSRRPAADQWFLIATKDPDAQARNVHFYFD